MCEPALAAAQVAAINRFTATLNAGTVGAIRRLGAVTAVDSLAWHRPTRFDSVVATVRGALHIGINDFMVRLGRLYEAYLAHE